MNKEWSELQKRAVLQIGKANTFKDGIDSLLKLRANLLEMVDMLLNLSTENLSKCPLMFSKGYDSKTIMYSYYHIARIEDICFNLLINKRVDVFSRENYQRKMHSPIKTTGNELVGQDIVEFSKSIDKNELKNYVHEVYSNTNEWLKKLAYDDLFVCFDLEDKERLIKSENVSKSERANFLIDYWCDKDIFGLIKMPFSRHWIMHVEASLKIKNKIVQLEKKRTDQIAVCGHSCVHCYLGQWCGGCRSNINCCSFALCSENGICPNVLCAENKNLDGCYECDNIENCTIGYCFENNIEAKGAAYFIHKYGKKNFIKALNNAIENGLKYPQDLQNSLSMKDACALLEKYFKN